MEYFSAYLIPSATVLLEVTAASILENSTLCTQSHYSRIQHYVTAFYRRDIKCLLRCTECVFIHNSVLTLVFRLGMGDTFLYEYFCSPLSVIFHHCSIHSFIYMFFLPEGKTDESWERSKNHCSFRKLGSIW